MTVHLDNNYTFMSIVIQLLIYIQQGKVKILLISSVGMMDSSPMVD